MSCANWVRERLSGWPSMHHSFWSPSRTCALSKKCGCPSPVQSLRVSARRLGGQIFARIVINYIPGQKMVESKSLKLYLESFRNHGAFHEDCVQTICDDLVKLLGPRYLEVQGEFSPRGGIAIWPFASYADHEDSYQELRRERFGRVGSRGGS